jgi:hypothetical protein
MAAALSACLNGCLEEYSCACVLLDKQQMQVWPKGWTACMPC